MAFKSITQYNQDRYDGLFMLRDDGDSADVIFLYRSIDDVLVADTHYIKSDGYSGYAHCLGARTCPACQKNIRVQTKLFIPVYVIDEDKVLFWDRSINFQTQLERDVFSKFANPTEYIFRITRHGAARDMNTRYSITAVYKNSSISYDDILAKHNIIFPDYYEKVCASWNEQQYTEHLSPNSQSVDVDSMPEYKLSPRNVSASTELPEYNEEENQIELPEFEDTSNSEEVESNELPNDVNF